MISKASSASDSAQTGTSAASGLNPFQQQSVRGKAFLFLQEPRTLKEFCDFVEEQGANAQLLLRYFRNAQLANMRLDESNGTLQWIVEG